MKNHKFKTLVSYYKPHRLLFFSDLLFAIIGAAISVVLPLLVRYITNKVVYWDSGAAIRTILMIIGIMLAMLLIEMYCNYFISYYGHIVGARIEYHMRNEIFSHYQKLSFNFFDDQKVGHLMSRVTNDLFDISELLHHGPEELTVSSIKLLGSLAILLTINWRLALVAFFPVPFMLWFAIVYNRKMKKAFVQNRERIGEINATMEDSLSGIRVVKSFANEDMEIKKFRVGNARFVESKMNSYRYMASYHTVLNALTTFITIAVAGAGAALSIIKLVDLSDLLVFLLYISNFTEPIKKLVFVTETFQNGFSGYNRFYEMMSISPDIADAPDAKELGDIKGEIRFNDVTFRYNGGEPIFEHLNLTVPAGDYVALVGSSGVGKTTLCSLIPRFYEVSSGSILIDGADIRSVTMKSLRDQIGIVQQDVYLFAETVMDNIRYGRPDATDEEVIEAAKKADAHEFIISLSEGYNTNIGQRGLKLSGGQKQRLSIARVLLKNPPILIFDEATSALDNESEKVVQESLEILASNRTTFVIAHRLSTIHNAKRILVLTQSGIAEEGTHSELMERGGVYASLYKAALI
ncbi:MAG: thiamine ABC transporter permease [Firmicutes bacterium HGW-Firmicutes-16]|nr:MAG: thiamine ABC transporter permease [Firmicutes bacterium HGW-Firmicutes-16]